MASSPSSPRSPRRLAGWSDIFEKQIDLAQWGPPRVREQRNAPRVTWTGSVRVRVGRELHGAFGIDVGTRGIRLHGDFEAPLRAPVSVTFELDGQLVHAVGEVTWRGLDAGRPAFGVRFSAMRRGARTRIVEYVAARLYGRGTPRSWNDTETVRCVVVGPTEIPRAPSYVPIRTGQTLSIDVRTGEACRFGPRPDVGPPLERLAP